MNLVNKEVIHKSFGKGSVIEQSDSVVEIHFPKGNKKFVFPDAFDKHLKLKDQKTSNLVKEKIQKVKEERQAKQAKRMEAEALLWEERQRAREQRRLMQGQKNHPSLQAVFWCEDEEEAKIFTDWNIFTGEIKSGVNKGQPNRLVRLNQNSACLITERHSDEKEKERRILGLYMVKEGFSGRLCEDGYIPAHEEFRLYLSEDEAKKMLFWNYYTNQRYPDRMTWNTGRYRYFENIVMAQILRDIVSLKAESDDFEFAQKFFKYFCRRNEIAESDIPENDGVLLRAQ